MTKIILPHYHHFIDITIIWDLHVQPKCGTVLFLFIDMVALKIFLFLSQISLAAILETLNYLSFEFFKHKCKQWWAVHIILFLWYPDFHTLHLLKFDKSSTYYRLLHTVIFVKRNCRVNIVLYTCSHSMYYNYQSSREHWLL